MNNNTDRKRILFYLIHPAKFHQFKYVINKLKASGHYVEIIIIGRDILEELVINEGWDYKIIFPKGRRIKGIHIWISSGLLFFPTILKLFFMTLGKKYDLFISDDLISYVGRVRGIPTIYVVDDDLDAVPQNILYVLPASHILAPNICNMGKYRKKMLGYYGYKALAHLHPKIFSPDRNKIDNSLAIDNPFYLIRTVLATSKHDVGKKGISDDLLRKIIQKLIKTGNVLLNSERPLPADLNIYQLDINKNDISHYLYFADIVIGDSTTMSVEAAVLGTPSIEIDDWFADFKQYDELCHSYELLKGFRPNEEEKIFSLIDSYILSKNLKEEFTVRRENMLRDKIDVSSFQKWVIEEYPSSIEKYKQNPDIQLQFR